MLSPSCYTSANAQQRFCWATLHQYHLWKQHKGQFAEQGCDESCCQTKQHPAGSVISIPQCNPHHYQRSSRQVSDLFGVFFFLVYFFAWINIQLQFEQQRIFHWYFRWTSLLELLFIIFKYFTICDRRVRFFFIWTPKGMSILITEYILMLIFQNVRHENAHRAFFIFSCKLTVKLQALQQKLPVLLPLQ